MYRTLGKKAFDITAAFLALIVLAPFLLLLAVLIRRRMGSPVLFRQLRPGLHGRPFVCFKFRTMNGARDTEGNLLPDSLRVTSLGQLLRSTSLDELPELINVVKGEMSLVGPRPLLMEYLPLYSERQSHRHDVRPGITGLAQINGRNALTWEEKFAYDLDYVENCGFRLDISIILKTFLAVFGRKGISHGDSVTMPRFTGTKN